MNMRRSIAAVTAMLALTATGNAAANGALARMHDLDGDSVGTVEFRATPFGATLRARLAFMPPGTHAFHIHETGECVPPFTSAGRHFNPDASGHGLMDDDGRHAGDMPNLHLPASGVVNIEVFNDLVNLDGRLFDDDGAAVVIHKGPDDYASNPAGAAGPRIACGVIQRSED